MRKGNCFSYALRVMAVVWACVTGCANSGPERIPDFGVQPWPAAEAMFRQDSRWLGGDGAGSIDLGNGRVLWLFGDSLIEPEGIFGRSRATMVRNSIAIQQGYNPSQAAIQFFWSGGKHHPADFFQADRQGIWLWPGHGIRLEERLLLFLMEIRLSSDDFFEAIGWQAVLIENPDQNPPEWRLSRVKTPSNGLNVMVGSAAVIREGDHVYAYGTESVQGHPVHLMRWGVASVVQGDLTTPQFWDEDQRAWSDWNPSLRKPPPLFLNGQMEFSVHFDSDRRRYWQVQTMSFQDADIVVRWAEAITGPWSEPVSLYHPPESDRKGLVVYAGKAHPEQSGADLIMTYAVNTFDSESVREDEGIYYPRFVRLGWNGNADGLK